ncbi:MAG: BamA/TamA family outer membrane protein, partial [Rubrivivax sp.]
DRIDRVDLPADSSARRRDERVLALLAHLDTRGTDWFSEGPNRGLRASLLFETYKPFTQGAAGYDGQLLRADLRGFVPLGKSVLALRWTEARASGRTAAFKLGGAGDRLLQIGTVLNERELSLRGYRGDEAELAGRNARVASLEWRTPLADIDRHTMVPPVGINRLSAALFFDAGGAWNDSNGPDRWRRGVGVELLGELKLLYALGLQLRAGVARGLDTPQGTQAYLRIGRSF